MTLSEIISSARLILDDTNADAYYWQDDELVIYVNEAIREACRRAPLLLDGVTTSVCQIAVTANTSTYDLSPLILRVLEARMSGATLPLNKTYYLELDEKLYNWQVASGSPTHFMTDEMGHIRLYPIPDSTGTLNLKVIRLPLLELTDYASSPEIPTQYHYALIDWVCHLAFRKQDAETENLPKVAMYAQSFGEKFGIRPTAIMESNRMMFPNRMRVYGRKLGE
jgi:hypothetical protein